MKKNVFGSWWNMGATAMATLNAYVKLTKQERGMDLPVPRIVNDFFGAKHDTCDAPLSSCGPYSAGSRG